jgi:hypothetical protein
MPRQVALGDSYRSWQGRIALTFGTETILAKDQLGKGEICSGDAASSGFERQILTPILKRYWQKE